MFQKNSFSIPSDSSGILLVKVIQTRKCNSVRHAKIGRFLRVVVRNTKTSLNKIKKKKVEQSLLELVIKLIQKKLNIIYFKKML